MKTKELLLNAYLDLSSEGSNLRDMAYAKAIMWVLYAEDKPLSNPEIINGVAQFVVGSYSIPEGAIKSALKLLKMKKLVLENGENWILSPVERMEMEKQIKYSTESTNNILKIRFPRQIDIKVLRNWFDESNSSYFSAGADKLLTLYTDKQQLVFNIEDILKKSIARYGLQKYEKELIQGYKEFLTSNEREEEEKILNLMRSILSAKLISANISPESLSLDKYKDSEILLDTNVLFAMVLDKGKELTRAFSSFGKVMKSLNIKLFIADFTKEEYEKVRTREKANYILLAQSFSKRIFQGMGSNRDMTRSILNTGCQDDIDIERFFDEQVSLPEKIGESKIEVLKSGQTQGSEYIEGKDKKLLNEIEGATLKRRGKKKGGNTAIHDLRLMKLVRKNNSSKKTFVLTLDGAMESLALDQVNDKEEPLWISLYSLIQILAINGGGPNFNPNDLAPLIKIFIEFEEATKQEKYDARDLLLIREKTERVNEIPEVKMISLLNQFHRVKLKRSEDEALREITLEIERTLRQDASKKDKIVREKENIIDSLTEKNKQADKKLETTKSKLQRQRKINIWYFFVIRIVIYIGLAILLGFFLEKEIIKDYQNGDRYDFVQKIMFVVGIALFSFTDYFTYTKSKLEKKED